MPEIGSTISHYEVVSLLGGGGMGVVYQARDLKLDRLVALKFLPPELSRDEATNERFMLEAKAASALDHNNICTVHEVGETDDGQLFIAMQLYEGMTLKQRLQGEVLSDDEALSVARQIAEGLSAAHDKGIVHRDIKPANVMLTNDGRAVILDFGLAKLPGLLSLTQTGSTLGTAAYMPPEQIRGEEIDGRADLWSLGVMMHEMLTGRRPFTGDYQQAIAYSILNEEASRPENVSDDVWSVVLQLLKKETSGRYADARALIEDLEAVDENRHPSARRAAVGQRRSVHRRTALAAIGLFAVVVIIAAILILRPGADTDRSAIDPNAIAVMPFVIRGDADLDYLGPGIVELLSMRLDRVAGLRSVDPNALLALIAKDEIEIAGPSEAMELANRLGAGKAILGSVIKTGDAIQISASLYAEPGEPLVEVTQATDGESAISSSLDAVARKVFVELTDEPVEEGDDLESMTSDSFEAVRSYLSGSHAMRRGRIPEAITFLEDAVERDSTFAVAWGVLAQAYGWRGKSDDEVRALRIAFRLRGVLPTRIQKIIESAYYGFVEIDSERAMDLLRTVLASHPHDLYALFFMGELIFHYNPLLGKSETHARQYFEQANQLGFNHVGLLSHLTSIALADHRYAEADSLAKLMDMMSGDPGLADVLENVSGLIGRAQGDSSWVFEDTGEMPAFLTYQLWLRASTDFEDTEAASQIASVAAASESFPKRITSQAQFVLGYSAAAEARFGDQTDTWASAGPNYHGRSILERSLVASIPVYPVSDDQVRSLRDEVSGWDTLGSPVMQSASNAHDGQHWAIKAYLDAILSLRLGEYNRLMAGKNVLAERSDSTSGRDLPYSLFKSLEAIEAWTAGEHERALDLLDKARLNILWRTASHSLLYEQVIDRMVKAEVHLELGEIGPALEHYRSLTASDHDRGLLFLGPSFLRQAEIYERLGDRKLAIEYLARLLRLWRNCDPELIPMREEARRNLDRLHVESTREPAG